MVIGIEGEPENGIAEVRGIGDAVFLQRPVQSKVPHAARCDKAGRIVDAQLLHPRAAVVHVAEVFLLRSEQIVDIGVAADVVARVNVPQTLGLRLTERFVRIERHADA